MPTSILVVEDEQEIRELLVFTLLRDGYEVVEAETAEIALERSGLTCNKNGVPFDPLPPSITSGIRFGSSAATTRGFCVEEFKAVGNLIADVLDGFDNNISNNETEAIVKEKVLNLCLQYPIY